MQWFSEVPLALNRTIDAKQSVLFRQMGHYLTNVGFEKTIVKDDFTTLSKIPLQRHQRKQLKKSELIIYFSGENYWRPEGSLTAADR